MVGMLMVLPLMPYYAKTLGPNGLSFSLAGTTFHLGIGSIVGILAAAFSAAQLLSAPLWGRFSDRFGRRPALIVGLLASTAAYIIFAFANSLWLLFLSRLVHGAGGGTVGVIQAYTADSTKPENRAKSLGWISAATNAGVMLGPQVGSFAARFGIHTAGLGAAALSIVNAIFVWVMLGESHDVAAARLQKAPMRARDAAWRVIRHSAEPASRLIWIYAIAIGAFQGLTQLIVLFLSDRFGVPKENIGYYFTYLGVISVVVRAFLLGVLVDRLGEPRLSRLGVLLLAVGLAALPFATSIAMLAVFVTLLPLGTAFTFPCVTAMLSRVVSQRERGLYMGLQQTFGGISKVIIPIWAGFAYDRLGRGVPFWTSAAMVLGTLLLGAGLERYAKHDSAEAVAAN